MSERDFAMCLALLAEAMGERTLTPVRIEAYHRGLKDIALPLLQATVDRLIQSIGSDSFRWTALPLVADIRKAAEEVRRELKAGYPWTPCAECEDTPRFRPVTDKDGTPRVERCPCVARYIEALTARGWHQSIVSLPAAEPLEPEAAPQMSIAQLPEAVGERLRVIARQKVLK